MGYRRTPFAEGEWFHCYSRGIDKRNTFESEEDCKRFIQLLYLANDTKPIERGNFYHLDHREILQLRRTEPIVAIGAYCLMKNHYHLLLKEVADGGISKFMQKVGTGYSMYFNEKYSRIGNLFVRPFRSKHIPTEGYLYRVTQYIHLNPAEIFESEWKKGKVRNIRLLEKQIRTFPFSSLPDYALIARPENAVLDEDSSAFLRSELPPFREILREAREYYAALEL